MKRIIFFLTVTALLFIAACSSRINPPSGDMQQQLSEKAIKGQKIYMDNCNTCHPAGRAGLGPGIFNKPLPGFMIKFQVRNGVGRMPAFKRKDISPEELDQLVRYIKEHKRRG
jgi:mono/diheme cytochrome c family protein